MITAESVTRNYKVGAERVTALNSVTLRISEGELLSVTGPSGSGKSTLLYTLGGLLTPNTGSVKMNEVELYSLKPRDRARFRRENVGFIFQSFELLPYLTALENVMLPLSLDGVDEADQRLWGTASLERVGLAKRADHKPSELSGGEQQRVAIARGLVNEPPLLLADEPTGNLDQGTGDEIMALLSALNKEGQTVVYITHDKKRAGAAPREVSMLDGRIVSDLIR